MAYPPSAATAITPSGSLVPARTLLHNASAAPLRLRSTRVADARFRFFSGRTRAGAVGKQTAPVVDASETESRYSRVFALSPEDLLPCPPPPPPQPATAGTAGRSGPPDWMASATATVAATVASMTAARPRWPAPRRRPRADGLLRDIVSADDRSDLLAQGLRLASPTATSATASATPPSSTSRCPDGDAPRVYSTHHAPARKATETVVQALLADTLAGRVASGGGGGGGVCDVVASPAAVGTRRGRAGETSSPSPSPSPSPAPTPPFPSSARLRGDAVASTSGGGGSGGSDHSPLIQEKMLRFVQDVYRGAGDNDPKVAATIAELSVETLPRECAYPQLHPLSYIREAASIPSELAAWRALKSMPAAAAAASARHHQHNLPPVVDDAAVAAAAAAAAAAARPAIAAAQAARKWYAHAAASAVAASPEESQHGGCGRRRCQGVHRPEMLARRSHRGRRGRQEGGRGDEGDADAAEAGATTRRHTTVRGSVAAASAAAQAAAAAASSTAAAACGVDIWASDSDDEDGGGGERSGGERGLSSPARKRAAAAAAASAASAQAESTEPFSFANEKERVHQVERALLARQILWGEDDDPEKALAEPEEAGLGSPGGGGGGGTGGERRSTVGSPQSRYDEGRAKLLQRYAVGKAAEKTNRERVDGKKREIFERVLQRRAEGKMTPAQKQELQEKKEREQQERQNKLDMERWVDTGDSD